MKKLLTALLSAVMIFGAFSMTTSSAASTRISLNKSSVTLSVSKQNGKTVRGKTTLKVKTSNSVIIRKLSYKSANKSIASVAKNGTVTAKKKGSTTVYVTVKYRYKKVNFTRKLSCKVKVKETRSVKKPVSYGETVYITPTGKKYHTFGCRFVKSNYQSLSLSEAIKRGYTACMVCH